LGKTPMKADVESFQVLNENFAKDKNTAYYRSFAIKNNDLDLVSFNAKPDDWMWHIGLDKNNVYTVEEDVVAETATLSIVEDADPSS
jgi:hypothetical protein